MTAASHSATLHPTALNVTVVGSGRVGGNLAVRLDELGHRVRFAVRDLAAASTLAALARVPGAAAVAVPAVAAVGDDARPDLLVLAVPFPAVTDVLDQVGDLTGVTVVDATNHLGWSFPDGCSTVVDVIERARPGAVVVKAFNTIGAEALLDPRLDGRAAFLPVAGPPAEAATVAALATAMGFDVEVLAGDDTVAMVESFARLWIHLAFRQGMGRDFGFARLTRGGRP